MNEEQRYSHVTYNHVLGRPIKEITKTATKQMQPAHHHQIADKSW